MLTIARSVLANLAGGAMLVSQGVEIKKMIFLLWVAISKIWMLYNVRCCGLWVNNKNSHLKKKLKV